MGILRPVAQVSGRSETGLSALQDHVDCYSKAGGRPTQLAESPCHEIGCACHLVPIIGKSFLKRSLGVTNRADAKKLRTIEDQKADALFADAEKGSIAQLGSGTSKQKQPLISMLIEHLRRTVHQLDKRSAENFANDPPSEP